MMFRVSIVRNLLDVLGVPRRQLSDTFSIWVSKSVPEILRIIRIVRLASTFRFVLLSNALVPKTAYIPTDVAGWRHLMRHQPLFQVSREGSVLGSGRLGAPKNPAVLDKSPVTTYESIVDLFPCTIAIGVPNPAVHVRHLEPRSGYPHTPTFAKTKMIEKLL